MKTVLLTSGSYRHQYIARCLAEQTDLQLIIMEEKSSRITDTSKLSKEESRFQKAHFEAREKSEINFFGSSGFPEVLQLKLEHGEINTELNLKILEELNPDFIILFGTSIIKKNLLKAFPGQFVNLHLGLSPWYKGSATNLFPLIDGKPQFVGATIHLATSSIDAGAILHQIRPEMKKNDGIHDIGNRLIEQAGKILPRVLENYKKGDIQPVRQEMSDKICRISDLTTQKLKMAYRNISDGMISDYLKNKNAIDAEFQIVSNLKE